MAIPMDGWTDRQIEGHAKLADISGQGEDEATWPFVLSNGQTDRDTHSPTN
jgi:hypothetical protein